jgi:hypothetical protein
MITEQKLRKALTKIERQNGQNGHGKPMSGLSVPAEYYFPISRKRSDTSLNVLRKEYGSGSDSWRRTDAKLDAVRKKEGTGINRKRS